MSRQDWNKVKITLLYAFKMTFVQLICFNIASHT